MKSLLLQFKIQLIKKKSLLYTIITKNIRHFIEQAESHLSVAFQFSGVICNFIFSKDTGQSFVQKGGQ